MVRFLFILLFAPCSAMAAGLDITADELNQDSYGTVIAKGNVIIKQRPARTLHKLKITSGGWKTAIADFDIRMDPTAANAAGPAHRTLMLQQHDGDWKIIADRTSATALPAITPSPDPASEIHKALDRWQQAWSQQDLASYFSMYSDAFKPDQRFASITAWQAYKKRVITNKSYIRIQLHDIRITLSAQNHAQAEFIQKYISDRINSRDMKRLQFEYRQNRWQIISESIIPGFTTAADPAIAETAEEAVMAWKNAWNRRDLAAYLDRYAPDVFPQPRFSSRQAWQASLQQTFALPAERTIQADSVRFNRKTHRILAKGHVQLQSAEGRIEAESAEIDSESKGGEIRQATLYLPNGERLQAKRLTRINDSLFEAEDARFSTCPVDNNAWAVRAKIARLDQDKGEFTARHTRFEVAGVPVLYTPWWSQTLKRKSGLLTPKVGSGKRRGTELGIPIYIAPQDNWDATLTPVWMSARGFMGETEVRHVSSLGSERIQAATIHDTVTQNTRSRVQGDIQWQLPASMSLNIKADHVSDYLYLADYASGSDTSTRYLLSTATLAQSTRSDTFVSQWSIIGQHQQDLTTSSNAATLQILPRLESRMQWSSWPGIRLNFDQQTTRFSRRTGLDGWRMDLHPYIELPWQLDGGGLSATMTIGSHHTRYWLQDINQKTTQQRTSGELSLELRSDFERISDNHNWRHQISPVLRYDYIQVSDQSGLANFDSAFGNLTWDNLLSGNRFSGRDRIERINRISMMLENRLQHKSNQVSRDLLLVRAGVAYDLLRHSVDPALQAAPTRPFSNILGEITFTPMSGIKLFGSGQYNPAGRFWATITSTLTIQAGIADLQADYQFTDARYANASQLISLSGSLQLGSRWQASGNWQYDNLLKLTQQVTAGLKYQHPCWNFGMEGYRTNRPNGTSSASDFGFRILLEFKGLGSVGSS